MPRKQATKPSSAPRSKEETLEIPLTAFSGQKLTTSVTVSTEEWRSEYMPLVELKPMNTIKYMIVFACRYWFRVNGRFLLDEEIQEVFDYLHGKHIYAITFEIVMRHLDNHLMPAVGLMKGMKAKERLLLFEAASQIYISICHCNARAMDRYRNLIRFPGRLTIWNYERGEGLKKIYHEFRPLRYDEVYILHAIANLLKDPNGDPIHIVDASAVADAKLKLSIRRTREIISDLRDPEKEVTKTVASAMKEPGHEEYFASKVQVMYQQCLQAGILSVDASNYPSASTPPRDDPEVTTAEVVAGLTAEIIAGYTEAAPEVDPEESESQPFNWEEFIQLSPEPKSGAEEETSGPSSNKASKKGKEKMPARP